VDAANIKNMAASAVQLARLYSKLALEERTLVNHPTGRAENVAEHSHLVSLIAPAIAEQFYPKLDANLVCRFATVHDAVEAYSGDVTTHEITEQQLKDKQALEAEGLENLKRDFANMPKFVEIIEQYETQEVAEARFVRVIDKWMPILLHYTDGGATLRSYTDAEALIKDYQPRAQKLLKEFPDFKELVEVRIALTQQAAGTLFAV
jgi:5'-deoxynucleotidase YfbR-like HD superfamily hydrolase